MEDRNKKDESGEIKKILKEFSQETTFHGIRYIADSQSHCCRRFLWTFVTLAAFAGFLYFIITQMIYLLEHPKAVNVEIIYTKKLPFPAVTVCNQNTFRASKAFQAGIYDNIEDTFDRSVSNIHIRQKNGCQDGNFVIFTEDSIANKPSAVVGNYSRVTIKLCKILCLRYHNNLCNSFVYDKNSKSCIIRTLSIEDDTIPYNNPGLTLVTYVRKRCLETMNCDFDGGYCTLYEEKHLGGMSWRKGSGGAGLKETGPGRDHTLVYGHYSYLDDSDTSGYPSESKLFSPFLQANVSLCMEFAYSLESPTGSYTLHVNKRDPQLQEVWTFPVEVTGGKWGSQFLFLGQGLYQIYFSATVKSGDNSGHIALDDVRIDRCTAFEYHKCRVSTGGTEYMGDINKTSTGANCLNWAQLRQEEAFTFTDQSFPEGSIEGAANYCRNPDGGDPKGPWCFSQELNSVTHEKTYCHIPYCACTDEQFQCNSGECISKLLLCDGTGDCSDHSDEIFACKKEVACNFESNVICGYGSNMETKTPWKRYKGRMRNGHLSEDHTTQSINGHYLYLDSGTITRTYRERVRIISPKHSPVNKTECLVFHASIVRDTFFPASMGEIIVYNCTGAYKCQRLLRVRGTDTSEPMWRRYLRFIRSELGQAYWIEFEGILGEPYLSDMAIDDVSLESQEACNDVNRLCWGNEFLCEDRNQCVDKLRLCDGQVDCSDFSDEDSAICDHKRNVICNFEDSFLCGYKDESNPDLEGWKHIENTKGNSVSISASSVASFQKKKLSSPWTNFEQDKCLHFKFTMNLRESPGMCSIILFEILPNTKLFLYMVPGDAVSPTSEAWRTAHVSLPRQDEVRLQFEVNCTEAVQHYDVHLGAVNVTDVSCWEQFMYGSFSCQFNEGEPCNFYDISKGFAAWIHHEEGFTAYLSSEAITDQEEPRLLTPILEINDDHCVTLNITSVKSYGQRPVILKVFNVSQEKLVENNETSENVDMLWGENIHSKDTHTILRFPIVKGVYRLTLNARLDRNSGLTISEINLDPGLCSGHGNCSNKQYECKGPFTKCISQAEKCDGKDDCWNGDDESSCGDNGYRLSRSDIEEAFDYSGEGYSEVGERFLPRLSLDHFYKPFKNDIFNRITDLTVLYQQLGHRSDDLISSCSWNGIPCLSENFTTQITDYGLCHTFNMGSLKNNMLLTARTGSSYGLRLLLNVEQYEHMKGPHGDAGVKIFLHDQKEVPFVRDLGFSVAPGSHALVAVKLSRTDSLGPPWGSCGTMKLNYTDTYTYSACMRECETKAMLRICGCRDSYMPGFNDDDPPICNISSFLQCFQDMERFGAANSSDFECNCTEPCTRKVYETQLSYGAISNLNIERFLDDGLDELKKKYHGIQEINQRTLSSTFLDDINMLSTLNTAYLDIIKFSKETIWSTNSSKVMTVHQSMKTFLQGALKFDLSTSVPGQVEDYQRAFEEVYGLQTRTINSITEKWATGVRILSQVLGSEDRTIENNTMLERQIDVIKHTQSLLSDALNNYHIEVSHKDSESISYTLLPQKKSRNDWCLSNITELRRYSEFIVENIDSVVAKPDIKQQVFRYLQDIERVTRRVQTCLYEYTDFLEGVSTWKRSSEALILKMRDTLFSSENRNTINKVLNFYDESFPMVQFQKQLEEKLSLFERAELTREALYTSLSPKEQSAALEKLHHFESNILNRLVRPIIQNCEQMETLVVETYQTLAQNEKLLSSYLGKNYKAATFTNWKIFYYPKANIDTPDSMLFEDKALLVSSVQFFLKNNPQRVLKELVHWHSRPIIETKDILEQGLLAKFNHIKALFARAEDQYKKFEKETRIDEHFIQKNFMAVDIYFAQLKYEYVKQMQAYTVDLFLSDIGGYLGLLLGGSAMSLFEFFDLVLYHFFKRKCSGSRVGRKKSQQEDLPMKTKI